MINKSIPRPDARVHAWWNKILTCVSGHLTDKIEWWPQ